MNKETLIEGRRRRVGRLQMVMSEMDSLPPDYEFSPEERLEIEVLAARLTSVARGWEPVAPAAGDQDLAAASPGPVSGGKGKK